MQDTRVEVTPVWAQLNLGLLKPQECSGQRMLALVEGLFGAEDELAEASLFLGRLLLQPSGFAGRAYQGAQVGLQIGLWFDVYPERVVRSAAGSNHHAQASRMRNGTDRTRRPLWASVRLGGNGAHGEAERAQELAGEATTGRELPNPTRYGLRDGDGFLWEETQGRLVGVLIFGQWRTTDPYVWSECFFEAGGQDFKFLFRWHWQIG